MLQRSSGGCDDVLSLHRIRWNRKKLQVSERSPWKETGVLTPFLSRVVFSLKRGSQKRAKPRMCLVVVKDCALKEGALTKGSLFLHIQSSSGFKVASRPTRNQKLSVQVANSPHEREKSCSVLKRTNNESLSGVLTKVRWHCYRTCPPTDEMSAAELFFDEIGSTASPGRFLLVYCEHRGRPSKAPNFLLRRV